jgi:putative addiction module component (TIGR02574 family)
LSDGIAEVSTFKYHNQLLVYTLAMSAGTDRVADVLRAALALPVSDREAVAVELLDSLEQDEAYLNSPPWQEELSRRIDEIESGQVSLRDWADIRRDLFPTPDA